MGWISGQLGVPFSSRAAIEFQCGKEFVSRVVDTVRYGSVIYAAVRSADDPEQVSGWVFLAVRQNGHIWVKPEWENMGPAEDACPARILDLLTEPSSDYAREWRERCRARIERGYPKCGQKVAFEHPISFLDGSDHRVFTFVRGSRFRSQEGALYSIPDWRTRSYQLRALPSGGSR